MFVYEGLKLLPIGNFAVVRGRLALLGFNISGFGFAVEPQVNRIATDVKQFTGFLFFQSVQFDCFDNSASKIFTVGAGHGQQEKLLTSLLVYVLRSLALAIALFRVALRCSATVANAVSHRTELQYS